VVVEADRLPLGVLPVGLEEEVCVVELVEEAEEVLPRRVLMLLVVQVEMCLRWAVPQVEEVQRVLWVGV
jgi:hypothetical protein